MHTYPRLVRDYACAPAFTDRLSHARAIVMRGNGAITVGATLEEAVRLARSLEDAARVELAVLSMGLAPSEFTTAEA
jgi:HCOMODA/2-hydroxy-3-carboxy-muconic semialdehyde decarboxylase